MSVVDLKTRVHEIRQQNRWREIFELKREYEYPERNKISWVWPSLEDLNWLNNVIVKNKLNGIVSIGCGCGLLEWLVQEHSGCEVVGIELDKSWWTSKYSPPSLLNNVKFIEQSEDVNIPENFAILFCYFNNKPAFDEYMKNYSGNVVIVVGPQGQNRYTIPLPFDDEFINLGWKVCEFRKMNEVDYIVVYSR